MNAAIKPIPEGSRTVTPHLVVDGGEAALDFYVSAFGAVEEGRMLCPSTGKLMHGSLKLGDSKIMVCDEFPEMCGKSPATLGGTPVTIALYVEDIDAAFAHAVEAGATPIMPPADMFWGDRYGKLVDPYGHHWSMSTHIADCTPAEMEANMEAMFAVAS